MGLRLEHIRKNFITDKKLFILKASTIFQNIIDIFTCNFKDNGIFSKIFNILVNIFEEKIYSKMFYFLYLKVIFWMPTLGKVWALNKKYTRRDEMI